MSFRRPISLHPSIAEKSGVAAIRSGRGILAKGASPYARLCPFPSDARQEHAFKNAMLHMDYVENEDMQLLHQLDLSSGTMN